MAPPLPPAATPDRSASSPSSAVFAATRGPFARATLIRPSGVPPLAGPQSSERTPALLPLRSGFLAHRADAALLRPPLLQVPELQLPRRGSDPLVQGLRAQRPVQAAPHSGGALWDRTRPPDPTFGLTLPSPPRPSIVPAPTMGVVPLIPGARHGPGMWPQFYQRLGELSYLCAYPGDKRRDSCSELLRGMGLGPIDGMDHRDISVVQGSQELPWLVSPTVTRGERLKMRYAVSATGQWCAALEASSVEQVLRVMRRELFGRGMVGMEIMLGRMSEGAEPLEGLTARLGRSMTVQHFVHGLVMGEVFCGQEVSDVVNCDGRLFAMVPLRAHPGAAVLTGLPGPLRKTLARRLLLFLAKLLRDMHEREVAHHNVCLDNVLIAPNRSTLSGLCSVHATGPGGLPSERLPTHVPPEMALHEPSTGRDADLWGLGMGLLRLLCGAESFLVAADVPHEQGLAAAAWQDYIAWHRTCALGRSPRGDAAPPSTALQQQLSRGLAAAQATDAELSAFLLRRLLVPRAHERLQGNALVSAAAALCRGTTAKEARALDACLGDAGPGGLAQPDRADVLARMAQLLPRWQAAQTDKKTAGGTLF